MRVQPRVLALVAALAATIGCVQASAAPTGRAQARAGIAAPGSARPTCDPDNGGLNLPAGFCALVVYDAKTATGGPAKVRDIAVAPNGDVFVADQSPGGGILALRDTDGDGKADETARFGTSPGNGIYFRSPYLYFAPNDRVERYLMSPDSLTPVAGPEVIVSGLPATGNHVTKTILVTGDGSLFVGVGSSTDSCQAQPGVPGSLGIDPCPDFPIRAGIWRYDANVLNQVHSPAGRFATGLRNMVALALNPFDGAVYGVQQGRGSLNSNFPNLFTPEDDAVLPSEELFRFEEGRDYGWPYCYYDGRQGKKVLAPEYGGDGTIVGRCADVENPLLAFPAHYAPNGMLFYDGSQFGEKYRGAAFIAFHGGANNPEAYNVTDVPFTNGQPQQPEVFADGFIGPGAVKLPADADHRAMALAEGPDGSLYITDDAGGRIWRVLAATAAEISVTGATQRLPDGDTIILDGQGLGHRLRGDPGLLAQLAQLAQYRITVVGTPLASPGDVPHYPIAVRDFRIEPGGAFDGQQVTVTGPTRRLANGDVIVVDEFGRGHRLTGQPFPAKLVGQVVTVSGTAAVSNAAGRVNWPIRVQTIEPVTLRFVAAGPAVSGLSPSNEAPAHPESTGTGAAVVTWDTRTSKMTVAVTFSGLSAPNTAAHIHCCTAAPGTTGVATTLPTFTDFPGGTTSGTYSHTFDMLDPGSYNPAFVAAHGGTAAGAAAALLAGLEAGQAYLNVHTTNFPAGEVRGFLAPT